jgi:hypothetical protein
MRPDRIVFVQTVARITEFDRKRAHFLRPEAAVTSYLRTLKTARLCREPEFVR